MDKLDKMFSLREDFMNKLKDNVPGSHPEWPLDLCNKSDQQFCRDMALRGVEEMFEALQHLKNWKPHRETEVPEINREEFLEEIVDAFNYFYSLIILMGVDVEEFYEAFNKKDDIIKERLIKGY